MSGSAAVSAQADGLRIRVRLTPSGGSDLVEGFATDAAREECLKARVRALARMALEVLLAQALRVPRSAVQIERGHPARVKLVGVTGLGLDGAMRKLSGDWP